MNHIVYSILVELHTDKNEILKQKLSNNYVDYKIYQKQKLFLFTPIRLYGKEVLQNFEK